MPPTLRHFLTACLLALALGTAPAVRADGAASVTTDVPAGQWRAVNLRQLTAGAVLAVEVRSDGPLAVYLVHQRELGKRHARALFRGVAERQLSFSVLIPEAGSYVAVMDNRKGDAARQVRFTAAARRGANARPDPAAPDLRL